MDGAKCKSFHKDALEETAPDPQRTTLLSKGWSQASDRFGERGTRRRRGKCRQGSRQRL